MGFGCRILHSKATCEQVRKCEGWFPQNASIRKGCKDAAKAGEKFSSADDYLVFSGRKKSAADQKKAAKEEAAEEQKKLIWGSVIGVFFLIVIVFLIYQISSR